MPSVWRTSIPGTVCVSGSRDNEDIFLPFPTHFQMHQDSQYRWRTLNDTIRELENNCGNVLSLVKTALHISVLSRKAEIGVTYRKIFGKKLWAVPMALAAEKLDFIEVIFTASLRQP